MCAIIRLVLADDKFTARCGYSETPTAPHRKTQAILRCIENSTTLSIEIDVVPCNKRQVNLKDVEF